MLSVLAAPLTAQRGAMPTDPTQKLNSRVQRNTSLLPPANPTTNLTKRDYAQQTLARTAHTHYSSLNMPSLAPNAPDTPTARPALSADVLGALTRLGVMRSSLTRSERSARIASLVQQLAQAQGTRADEMHIILDGALGTPVEVLAQQYKLPQSAVEHALSHPYVLLLQRELAAAQAEGAADPMRRVEQVANEMLDVKLDIVRDVGTHPRLRNEIASDLLDRGGLRKPTRIEADVTHRVVIDASIAARLRDTLRELEVQPAVVPYEQHLLVNPAAGERELAPGLEQPAESRGASPTTPDVGAQQEVAA